MYLPIGYFISRLHNYKLMFKGIYIYLTCMSNIEREVENKRAIVDNFRLQGSKLFS